MARLLINTFDRRRRRCDFADVGADGRSLRRLYSDDLRSRPRSYWRYARQTGIHPGFDIFPDDNRFREIIKDVGVAIIGQTSSLAPADKRFYATRDITATVDSIPLITASILAKKLAEGLDALVMDVKVGSGAFMPTYELSEALAEAIVGVANGAGVRTTALLTDMNQVLASSAGNAVEVREAVQFLTGEYRNPRLFDVTMALCVEMLISGKLAKDDAEARAKLQAVLDNGKAAEVFGRMVAAQKAQPTSLRTTRSICRQRC